MPTMLHIIKALPPNPNGSVNINAVLHPVIIERQNMQYEP